MIVDLAPLIDKAMLERKRQQIPRTYLGASRWGEECSRMLAYEWHKVPTDCADKFPAPILRIFDMGHDAETRMAEYLRLAGFDLVTEKANGHQFGFSILGGVMAGHCDGIIHGGPLDLPYPLVWENKGLNDKSWKTTKAQGLEESKPTYYGQLQTYSAYLDVHNGGLITTINRNTGEIYAEYVPFVPAKAQELSDRALRIVQTDRPEEMTRLSDNPSFFKCAWCDYQKRCHNIKEMTIGTKPTNEFPAWLNNKH